jgi:hypothetical protein
MRKVILFVTIICNCIIAQDLIVLEFSEPMDTINLFNAENYFITCLEPYSNLNADPEIKSILKPIELPYDELIYIYLVTDEHLDGEYKLEIFNVFDLAGNPINIEFNFAFYDCNGGEHPSITTAGK